MALGCRRRQPTGAARRGGPDSGRDRARNQPRQPRIGPVYLPDRQPARRRGTDHRPGARTGRARPQGDGRPGVHQRPLLIAGTTNSLTDLGLRGICIPLFSLTSSLRMSSMRTGRCGLGGRRGHSPRRFGEEEGERCRMRRSPVLHGGVASHTALLDCAFGECSAMAIEAAHDAGITGCRHIAGGLEAWRQAGGAVVRRNDDWQPAPPPHAGGEAAAALPASRDKRCIRPG